jgi:hypothetical protein
MRHAPKRSTGDAADPGGRRVLSREVVWRGVGWDKEGGEREEIREEEGK